MDTTFFRLLPDYASRVSGFFEVDFATVIEKKREVIRCHPELSRLAMDRLKLVAADLRSLSSLLERLTEVKFAANKPTIFYSECVVNYLNPNE
jgi:O-methyltransferase involved in polyketide biosynthesis